MATEKERFLPGRDPENIRLAAVIDAVRAPQSGRLALTGRAGGARRRVIAEIEQRVRRGLGDRSLKDLIAAP